MLLKETLNLPRTDFPMRGNLTAREPARLAHWESMRLYQRIQRSRPTAGGTFVLHDGPPFTNGDVHIGTALNKLLKDMVLRHMSMCGYRTPYVPGWDCHGLPIEHKVSKEVRAAGKTLTPAQLRAECAAFSARYIETQRSQFKRLGVLANWDSGEKENGVEKRDGVEYRTMDSTYEADILRVFAQFVERGLVYRALKPVLYSIPFQTALAEAEIEYKDHVSPAIYVKFPVPMEEAKKFGLPSDKPLFVVIWTTTPWTLPANLAIAVHPKMEYVVVETNEGDPANYQYFLAAQPLLPNFISKTSSTSYRKLDGSYATQATGLFDLAKVPNILVQKTGSALEGLQARHPFIDRASPVVLAEYVTTDTGTGCVHTAPGHGLEDYQTGLKYKLDIYCPLDDYGCYVNDGKIPAELVGVTVLEKSPGKCPANDKVLEILTARGALLANHPYAHQYPHCWRSKTPVIFRAMSQWFIALDKSFTDAKGRTQNSLRALAVEAVGTVQWVPASGENRIRGAVESRPDWCISRQRAWGVPIPAFFGADNEAHLDAGVIRALADKMEKHGSNLWFEEDAEKLLEGMATAKNWPRPLKKSADTLDVWIDSGSSHYAVLKRQAELTWPADLYLEGSDQHRGWFQSSLWTALATDAAPPYRAVLTHGFVVDENGRKISKSDGKPQTADDYVKKYGADLIRFWVASEDFRKDITLSENIFSHVSNTYRGLRNTFMYQLGNLADFNFARDAVGSEHFTPLEKWALYNLHGLVTEVTAAFDAYDFHLGVKAIDHFVSVTLSRQYHDILKDRLYTFAPAAPARRAAQTATHAILRTLLGLLAPVLPFTTDEAFSHLTAGTELADDSIHLQSWPQADPAWASADFKQTAEDIEVLLKFRERVYEKLEALRQEKKIGKFLDAQVRLTGPEAAEPMPLLRRYADVLPELFIVSQVVLNTAPGTTGGPVEITVIPASEAGLVRCPRSWRWVPELVDIEGFEEKVSPRDRDALAAKYPPK